MDSNEIHMLRLIAEDNDGHAAQFIERAADTIEQQNALIEKLRYQIESFMKRHD
jgi:hypothetical protein